MLSLKRQRDDNDGQSAARNVRFKVDEIVSNQQGIIAYSNLSERCGDFQITLKLRFMSKAKRNDPYTTPSYRELREEKATTEVESKHSNDGHSNDGHSNDGHSNDDSDDDSGSEDDNNENDNDNDDDYASENDSDFEFEWLKPIDAEVVPLSTLDECHQPKRVAYYKAKLIRQAQIHYEFYMEMEQPSEETSMLAFGLFDRYGRLRPEFTSHPIIRGTGVWGKELDYGDILLIEEIFVNQFHRRRQLGRKMVEALLTLVRQKTISFFVFVRPALLKVDDIELQWDNLQSEASRDEMKHREENRAIQFYRSLGFRRLGSTTWFAIASDDEHASHRLASTEDFDPPNALETVLHPFLRLFDQSSSQPLSELDQILLDQQPSQDLDFLGALKRCFEEMGSDNTCWKSKNKNGNTVLHLVAAMFSFECVEWVLNQDFGTELLELRNNRGETPLELLQFKLEKLRTQRSINAFTTSVSDQFRGHSDSAVRCMILLKGMGTLESFLETKGHDALERLFGGCTCGQCLHGCLSPRMARTLQIEASTGYEELISTFRIYDSKGEDWVELCSIYLRYLPSKVFNNLKTNRSMRQGFINLWQYISSCLENGFLPREGSVRTVAREANEWPPVTRNFFERGGSVEPVFLAICRKAMEQDEWIGHELIYEDSDGDMPNLPECRNDLEFGFVSGCCGYRRISLSDSEEDGNVVESSL